MALKLFEHPLSPYARKLKLVIYEKGIPIQRVYVNPNAKSDDSSFQEFVLASPRLEVPVLTDGDLRIFDSTIALEYLEERWPRPATDARHAGRTGPDPDARGDVRHAAGGDQLGADGAASFQARRGEAGGRDDGAGGRAAAADLASPSASSRAASS
jgi:glutathione S-transferase